MPPVIYSPRGLGLTVVFDSTATGGDTQTPSLMGAGASYWVECDGGFSSLASSHLSISRSTVVRGTRNAHSPPNSIPSLRP